LNIRSLGVSNRPFTVVEIDQVIGPRLDRRSIVVETHTPAAQIALRLSPGAAASLSCALTTALRATGGPELPEFLSADPAILPASRKRRAGLRTLLRRAGRSLIAGEAERTA
jgi:hypothetical protein